MEQIKNTNQKLQNWIKSCKERQDQKLGKNQLKNNSQKEEKNYEEWQKKLNSGK